MSTQITLSLQTANKMLRFLEKLQKDENIEPSSRSYARLLRSMLEDKKDEYPRGFSVNQEDDGSFTLLRKGSKIPSGRETIWKGFSKEESAWKQAKREILLDQGRQRAKRQKIKH